MARLVRAPGGSGRLRIGRGAPACLGVARPTPQIHPRQHREAGRMKAVWNGKVIAESSDIVTVEGNAYFPESALNRDYVTPSTHSSVCPWKGTAQYYSLSVDGKDNKDAVWYYPAPKDAAAQIKGRVAFWKGVTVT
jgi:uncharacterized protein (DUF427 family)